MYQKWGKPGMVLPDSEKKRLEYVKRHLEAVKKCDKEDIRKVYETDYNEFMNIHPPKNQQEVRRFSHKRPGTPMGGNKRYKRF